MIDYLPHFEPREGSEYHRVLTALDPPGQVYPAAIIPRYRRRWSLLFYWTPRLFLYGCAEAWRYLTAAAPPAAIVAWDYLPLLPLVLARGVRRRPVKLILVGFIFTRRRHRWLDGLRRLLFRRFLAQMDRVIVHSTDEIGHYAKLFGLGSEKFVFLPVAAHMASTPVVEPTGEIYVAAAGRSNRDYALLLQVAAEVPVRFKIACDTADSDLAAPLPPNVEVLRNCHSADYLRLLAGAAVVAVPLKDDQLSAGQMVLLHALALGRAVVVTKSSATADYVEADQTALCVERGSASSFAQALRRLLDDPEERRRLGAAARKQFEARHTLEAFLRRLHACVIE
jgi:glycosyltransferase involved in cell wall biosynthesis